MRRFRFRVSGFRFRFLVFGFRVWGFGFGVLGFHTVDYAISILKVEPCSVASFWPFSDFLSHVTPDSGGLGDLVGHRVQRPNRLISVLIFTLP